jgi:selenium-binding protein 1
MSHQTSSQRSALFAVAIGLAITPLSQADETCNSPYMKRLTTQEDFMYIWTLGVSGVGDEQDKLVTVDTNPASKSYGKVIHSLSVGGRNEAHHSGYSDDRRTLWAGGLDTSNIFVFDVASDPAKPKLKTTITDFVAKTGGIVGPHSFYALPGRMLITGLSNNQDHGGRTGMAEYTNDGEYIATHWMPTDDNLQGATKTGQFADGYGYDIRALPRLNVMVSSSFTGWNNYMMDLGKMMADGEAMKRFGNTVTLWDLHTRKPLKVFDVPGAPLEVRCAWGETHDYCFTTTALTSKIWLIHRDGNGEWQAKEVADIGDPAKIPLPVDISIAADDSRLWVNTWNDGMTRLYDITDPHAPKEIYSKHIGEQVNMVSQSWDGKRVYFTSSLLGNWDKKQGPAGDLQYFKAYHWDGKELKEAFAVDFVAEKLGLAHQMTLNARSMYAGRQSPVPPQAGAAGGGDTLAASLGR